MQMSFTNSYRGVPILFESWGPSTKGGFVGSFLAIILVTLVMRALIFLRAHLEAQHWSKSVVSRLYESLTQAQKTCRQPFRIVIEIQRMLFTFVLAVLGYGLMLVAMTYVAVRRVLNPLIQGIFLCDLSWTRRW